MKYELSDLKNVADELLEDVRVDRSLALRIAAKCAAPQVVKKTQPKRWFTYAAASCVVCAAAAVFIFTASMQQNNTGALAGIAGAGLQDGGAMVAMSTQAGAAGATQNPDAYTARVGTMGDAVEKYAVEQGDSGKFGVKGIGQDGWLVEPEYDSGFIEDGVAYMTKGADSVEISLGDIVLAN